MGATAPATSPIRVIRLGLLSALLVGMPWMSFDFGIPWDELTQLHYGKLVARFYTSFFADTSAIEYRDLYLYGGLYELSYQALYAAIGRWFPSEMSARHFLISFYGWSAILFACLLARRLFGELAALLTVVLLALSPRFVGHAMNNDRDIPFAALYVACLYFMSGLRARYPYIGWRDAVGAVVTAGLCIGVRPGGLLLVCYAGLFVLIAWWRDDGRTRHGAARAAGVLACGSVCALLIGSVVWPYALLNPWLHPFVALKQVTAFHTEVFVLFQGKTTSSLQLPWYYLPTWVLIATPLAVLLGAVGLAVTRLRDVVAGPASVAPSLGASLTWFSVLFPIVFIAVSGANVYDGMRHVLFVVPPLSALAAAGWAFGIERARRRSRVVASLVALALAALLVPPLRFNLRHHPNQVVYFNELVGGTAGALHRFELDYWGNCYRQSVDAISARARAEGRVARITSIRAPHLLVRYAAERPEIEFVPPPLVAAQRGSGTPLYRIDLVRLGFGGGDPGETWEQMYAAVIEPGGIVDRVEVDGSPLCVTRRLE